MTVIPRIIEIILCASNAPSSSVFPSSPPTNNIKATNTSVERSTKIKQIA